MLHVACRSHSQYDSMVQVWDVPTLMTTLVMVKIGAKLVECRLFLNFGATVKPKWLVQTSQLQSARVSKLYRYTYCHFSERQHWAKHSSRSKAIRVTPHVRFDLRPNFLMELFAHVLGSCLHLSLSHLVCTVHEWRSCHGDVGFILAQKINISLSVQKFPTCGSRPNDESEKVCCAIAF